MTREAKPNAPARAAPAPTSKASVHMEYVDGVALVKVTGLVDESFAGFGALPSGARALVLDVSTMTRMTSFGVRQWIKAMDRLPKLNIPDVYVLGCPTFFVDQLNMVLNFCGTAKVLSVVAPYTCPSCGVESGEVIDVLAERGNLAKGGVPDLECRRCSARLELDETPESYFSFLGKYGASTVNPDAATVLAERGLFRASVATAEKPPRIIKLVHGQVTYFRLIGTLGSMFRARPLLVGAEGEVVIDLAEVARFDATGRKEWQRLLKNLTANVTAVTLVDVNEHVLEMAGDTFALGRDQLAVASVFVPYSCGDCGRTSHESVALTGQWPLQFGENVCATCGGISGSDVSAELLERLRHVRTAVPAASAQLIGRREELVSRALTDAKVAEAGDRAARTANDGAILGKYKIVRRLSAGGMAEVFLAKQTGLGGFEKPVALKRIQRQLLDNRHMAIDMFLNEAKIAGRLTHPGIVQVLDVGEVEGALYLAMEYVRGKDLRDVVKQLRLVNTRMPLGNACYIVREVAQALHYAYWSTDLDGNRLSVVHRDVTPHNIILGYDGTIKLLDFGVAMSSVTEQPENVIVGKWLYMPPEATTGTAIDHRSDLFSLGVTLYLLLTGSMPFTGTSPKEIVPKIQAGDFKPLGPPDAPERLAALVNRMLAAKPDDRPQNGMAVASELSDIMRVYDLQVSSTTMTQFLAQVFPHEIGDPTEPIEINAIITDVTFDATTIDENGRTPVSESPFAVKSGAPRPTLDDSVSMVPHPADRSRAANSRSSQLLTNLIFALVVAGVVVTALLLLGH